MNKIIILTLVLMMSGCSAFSKKDEAKPVVVEQRIQTIPVFHPPLPDGADLSDIEWKVMTPELMREYLADLDKGEAPPIVLYSLTPEGYKQLANNIAELKRVMKGYIGIILYYRGIKETTPPPKDSK